ncbi:MAG: T9SS type A sorting domain-containing protein [Bacteroidales bacterium]|jgi:hypothetical protein|nr:T9SS type A sorting domain-containing protein [Bacteroidales bacterium]
MARGILCFFYGICFEEDEDMRSKRSNEDMENKRNTEYSQQRSQTNTANIAEKDENDIIIYPNLTNGVIYFDNIDKKVVNLYTPNGKLLQVTKRNYLDLSKYPAGLYYLKVDNEAIKVQKEWYTTNRLYIYGNSKTDN